MPGWETIVVIIVVAVAAVWSARSAWRSVRQGKVCSGCSDSASCPMVGNPSFVDETSISFATTPVACPDSSAEIDYRPAWGRRAGRHDVCGRWIIGVIGGTAKEHPK
ncbi:MAG: FeoB-associated Cys-rich membrane protein [Gemmatimonadales bacterium]|nr:FeoB-associated Cys-rich membrane protein [Gemmatimonadales bacterium]